MEKKLEEDRSRQKKSGAQAHGRHKPRAPGDKLKTETSAKQAMRKKIRHGKANNELTEAEKKLIRKKQVQGRRAIDRDMAAKASFHKKTIPVRCTIPSFPSIWPAANMTTRSRRASRPATAMR